MAVAFDAVSTSDVFGNNVTSFSDSTKMTVGSGSNRALLVTIAWKSASPPTGVSITWNGVALSLISGTSTGNASANANVAIYGLLNPASGTQTLAGSWTGSTEFAACAVSYTGVDQSSIANAFPNGANNNGNTASPTVTVTSKAGDAVLAVFSNTSHGFQTTGNTQTYNDSANNNTIVSAGCRDVGAASVSLSFSISASGFWVAGGVDIAAAPFTTVAWLSPLDKQPVPQRSITTPAAAITLQPSTRFWSGSWGDTLFMRDPPNDGVPPAVTSGQPVPQWAAAWGDTLIFRDLPSLLSESPSAVTFTTQSSQWAASWGDTLLLRDPPVEPQVSIALTPATLPAKISGMAWYEPPDRDRPALRVWVESRPARADTPPIIQPTSVAGIAWQSPLDLRSLAVRITIESPASVVLTPLTLPPQIAGMSWFEPPDRDRPRVRVSFDEQAPFGQFIVQPTSVAGVAWFSPWDQYRVTARIPSDAPQMVVAPSVAPTLFWSNTDDRIARKVLADIPVQLALSLASVPNLGWDDGGDDRLWLRRVTEAHAQPALLPIAAPVVPQLFFGWDDGGDDRIIARKSFSETAPSLVLGAAIFIPTLGWVSVSDDRIVRKAPVDVPVELLSGSLSSLSSGWMTLAADRVSPAVYREVSREALVLNQQQLPSPFGVLWASPIDGRPLLVKIGDALCTFIAPPTPVGVSGIAWFSPSDQRYRSPWVFEGGAVPGFFGKKFAVFEPSPRRATPSPLNRSVTSTPP